MGDKNMKFIFDARPSDSSFVEAVWRTQSESAGSFISLAESHWGMVVTRQKGKTYLTVRGPETKAMPVPVPESAEFFGIVFKLGTFMPRLPARSLVDGEVNLPEATSQSFWLHGSTWQFPNHDNAEVFVNRLVREEVLVCDPLVGSALETPPRDMSVRSMQRRFL